MLSSKRWAKLFMLCVWPLSALASLLIFKWAFDLFGILPLVAAFLALFVGCYFWPSMERAGTLVKIRRRTSALLSKSS